MHPLVSTLQISNRINLYVLEAISIENLVHKAGGKGRTVGEQWAHLHNVRLLWLDVASPVLKEGLQKIEKEQAGDLELLKKSLLISGGAIEKLLEAGLEQGKIKGFKPHPEAFLGYILAHEAHHRGQILLTLKLNGCPIAKKTAFGMWEWGVR